MDVGDQLSDRERDILRLLGAGRTTREIADEIGIAESSVAWYIRHLSRDLGPRRFDELATRLARGRANAPRRRRIVRFALIALAVAGATLLAATAHPGAVLPPTSRTPVPSATATTP